MTLFMCFCLVLPFFVLGNLIRARKRIIQLEKYIDGLETEIDELRGVLFQNSHQDIEDLLESIEDKFDN